MTAVAAPTSTLALPSTLNEAGLRTLLDQALQRIANDIWTIYDDGLRDSEGDRWPELLSRRDGGPIGFGDLSAQIKVLRDPPQERRDLFRQALGVPRFRKLSQSGALDDIRKIRNTFAHPDGSTADIKWVEWALSRLMNAAKQADLESFPDLQAMSAHLQRLQAPQARQTPRPGDFEKANAEFKAAQQAAADAARREEEANAAREQAEEKKLRAEEARRMAEGQVRDLRAQLAAADEAARRQPAALEALRRAESEKAQAQAGLQAAHSRIGDLESAEKARAEVEAALTRERAEKRRAESALAAASAEIEHKQAALDEQVRRNEDAVRRLQEAENTLLMQQALHATAPLRLATPDYEPTQVRAPAIPSARSAPRSPDRTAERLTRALQDALSAPAAVSGDLPAPGGRWPYPRGRELWRLSRLHHTLVRSEDEVDLADIIGKAAAKRLVAQFLDIRPSGGRVWVDDDSDAVTYVDGSIVYLGRLEEAPALSAPVPGAPLADVAGRAYTLTRAGGIECRATGQTLAEAVGRDTAKAVAARIAPLKPQGGRLRVSRDGTVATYIDGQWAYVTRVRAHEWFPGHVR